MSEKQNANPVIFSKQEENEKIYELNWNEKKEGEKEDEEENDEINNEEVFELIRHLNDPEHPLSLEQLNVVQVDIHH